MQFWLVVKLGMMTSSNGNIFRATGPLCGEFTGPSEVPAQRPVTRNFDVSLIYGWINDWVNNREAGGLRRHPGHCDVNVMFHAILINLFSFGLGMKYKTYYVFSSRIWFLASHRSWYKATASIKMTFSFSCNIFLWSNNFGAMFCTVPYMTKQAHC